MQLIVTATVIDNTQQSIRRDQNGTQTWPFDYGSGHIRPAAAVDPGLIYEFDSHDVINFLCSIGASPLQLKNLTGNLVHCQNPPVPSYKFNYPSIGLSNLNGSLSVYRRVTYYGNRPTTYVGEKMSFMIDFTPINNTNGSVVFGALRWTNGIQSVRSPIAINVISS